MRKILQIIKEHKWAILAAVFIIILMTAPEIYFRWKNQNVYQGVLLGGMDEVLYLNRIQEVRDGYYSLGNSLWAEGKDAPYLTPPLSEIIAASFGKLFGLGLANTVLLEYFVFPTLIFFFIYIFVYRLTKRKLIGLLASVTVLLSTNLLDPVSIWNLLTHQKTIHGFLAFNRPISPQTHSLFFFSYLMFFWFFWEKKKWIYGIFSGIILGLSFYTFPYTWSYLYSALALLFIISLFRKNWPQAKKILLVGLIGIIVAIPYFYNFYQAIHHPAFSETSLSFGTLKTHAPEFGAATIILLALFLLFFPRSNKERYDFSLALILAPFIVLNQQIITGITLFPAHYHWYIHKPIIIIFIIIILFERLANWMAKSKWLKFVYAGLATLILLVNFDNAVILQTSSYKGREPIALDDQNYGPAFHWLNEYAQKGDSVLANPHISWLLTVYTPLDSVYLLHAHYYLITDRHQILERYFLEYRLSGLTAKEAKEKFIQDRFRLSADLYGQHYRKLYGGYDKIPDEEVYRLADEYIKFSSIPLKNLLEKFSTDYLIWDILQQPEWQIEQYPFFKLVEQDQRIKLYKFIDEP